MKQYKAKNGNCESYFTYKKQYDYIHPEDIHPGDYIGISICDYYYTGYNDVSNKETYTASEVFKVRSVDLVKNSIWGDKEYLYALETPDRHVLYLTCKQNKEKDTLVANSPVYVWESGKYIKTVWTADPGLIRWIEKDLYTASKRDYFTLTIFKDALSVKKAIEDCAKYKENAKKAVLEAKRQEELQKQKVYEYNAANQQAAAELDRLWRSK